MGILTASQAEILGKIERNAAIKLRSLSSAVVALATGGAAYWFSLSSADQAAKLAEHPVLVPYAPYIIGLGWLVAALYPQWIRLNASKAEQFAAMRAELERLKAAVLAGERGQPAVAAPAPTPAITVAPPPAPVAPAPRVTPPPDQGYEATEMGVLDGPATVAALMTSAPPAVDIPLEPNAGYATPAAALQAFARELLPAMSHDERKRLVGQFLDHQPPTKGAA